MFFFFFFNDTATTEIYTLSLHDALPIYTYSVCSPVWRLTSTGQTGVFHENAAFNAMLTEIGRHTSELQSQSNLVCRLLLEKKKNDLCCALAPHGVRAYIRTAHKRVHRLP